MLALRAVDNLRVEVERLERDLADAYAVIWCLVKQAGGEVRLSLHAMEQGRREKMLASWRDGASSDIIIQAGDRT
ncbi:conserved protein of unknown function (plasmid) [Rhodovastum atsumiense]|uniref:Uncharacterized protein n=1 Tax=Rhodovastum atsumiense TaxID=504468 RepID=A0A5M6IUV9_9PROT|nr:hypothetical protein [Rhodovastum atsumiense]KAA5611647.1 hypothetical protein F1189_13890 [Rhodovastum atsumiense]CAH2606255.1 conserved protein of unknown function [Rhodovastum atsumiense]